VAATALVRLAKLTGNATYQAAAEKTLAAGVSIMRQAPTAMGQSLVALDFHLGPTYELVFAGNLGVAEAAGAVAEARRQFLPNRVVAAAQPGETPPELLAPLLAGKNADAKTLTLYVCEGFTCQAPVVGPAAIATKLAALPRK
jgi:uncharacterized protein YyaL (SSP411 family)